MKGIFAMLTRKTEGCGYIVAAGRKLLTARAASLCLCVLLFLLLTAGAGVGATGSAMAEEPDAKMPDKPLYTGSEMCGGRCHDPWYQAWKATPHARTYAALKPGVSAAFKRQSRLDPNADYTGNPNCLRCHTTGYGQKGGFMPGKTLISKSSPNMEQVGCEMCHTSRGGAQVRVIMKRTKGNFKRPDIERWGARYDYENVCHRCHGHAKSPHPQKRVGFSLQNIHDYKKYYNDNNKEQTYKIEHGKGVTEAHPLAIEDWDIVEGKIHFKKLPLWEGWLVFKRK